MLYQSSFSKIIFMFTGGSLVLHLMKSKESENAMLALLQIFFKLHRILEQDGTLEIRLRCGVW